ncbi:MAG: hypothetical protein KBA55_07255 [Ruminococcus sp.]|nr:hypothetical protein [Ruminococcus sp.]
MFEKKNNLLKSKIFRTLRDPVLIYLTFIMISIMYHYRSSLALVYGLFTFIGGWLVFRVFDFIQKHKFIGFIAYCALGAAVLKGVRWSINKGHENYPIIFGLWFLSPQDAVDYNQWYTLAIFLLFFMFMASVIYYFTRVRYRIFMNFLIFIIPFAIFGKEYEQMPTIYIILLSVGYVLLMARFRQYQDDENTKIVCRNEIWKPLAVYAVIFAAASALIPKPAIEADRNYIETLINAEELTDRLDAMLNVFRDTSTAQQFRVNMRKRVMFYGKSDEELRLKTSTRTKYSFASDEWKISDIDTNVEKTTDELPVDIYSPGELLEGYLKAAELDSNFAQKYCLSQYADRKVSVPDPKQAVIQSAYRSVQYAPVPQFATDFTQTSHDHDVNLTDSGLIYAKEPQFASNATFSFDYSSERFIHMGDNKEIIDAFGGYDYKEMTDDAIEVLDKASDDASLSDKEREEIGQFGVVLDHQYDILFSSEEELLDYGNRQRIKNLSDQITEGIDSEFDKAKAFEYYFYTHDYNYDLNYIKEKGENVESFIFDTKTGVCYEYATAMVLLARAAGIPARFCIGYNMTEPNDGGNSRAYNFVVTTNDAHAFPELYIKGYGWMSFEPTIADVVEESEDTSATDLLARAGLIILGTSLLILAFIMLYPRISHRIFLLLSKKKRPAETARAVMKRICRMYGIEGGCTSKEAAELAAAYSGTDISKTAELFDKAVYGEQELDEQEKETIMEEYVQAYKLYMEKKKLRRKPANSQ